MDQNTWLRRKRSSEKSIAANNEAEISVEGTEEEKLPYEKEADLEKTVKDLHEKVAYLLSECKAKDEFVAEQAKRAQEANTGWKKAEAEVAIRKQKLEDTLQQKVAANERLVHLNAALKNCRQQLCFLKVEQDHRVKLERAHKRLESKYSEARKKLANLTVENAQLTIALITKEEIIEDASNQMSRATSEFNALISRLDSNDRGNDVLTYEYHVLKRKLKLRNRCTGMEHKQHKESAKLAAERQRLRLLVGKWSPGLVKTKPNNHTKAVDRRMSSMIKRLCEVEEENKILKETACKRENEIRLFKAELGRMRCDERNIGLAMQYKMIGDLGMSLMDGHGEMEKFAIVSVDGHSSDKDNLDMVGKELVPTPQGDAFNSSEKDYDWLQGVLKEMLKQNHASKRSFDELLEDVRTALQCRYHSSSMVEKQGPINKLDEMKPVLKDLEAKLLESENKILALKTELECLKESERMTEDHFENLKLINMDLDHQLSVAKVQIKEALRKVSYLEMELEDRSHRCEGLEATFLELQLQLASISSNGVAKEDVEQEERRPQTGLEMTTELTNNKKSSEHSLRDHMAAEDSVGMEDVLDSPMTKEIISTTETKEPSVPHSNTCSTSYGIKNVVPQALSVVPSKKRGKGTELLRKLLFRRKRGGSRMKLLAFATYQADLVRNKDRL